MFKILLQAPHAEKPVELTLDRVVRQFYEEHVAHLDGRPLAVELETTGPGEGWLRAQERVYPFRAVRQDDRVSLWLAGELYEMQIVERTPRRAGTGGTDLRREVLTAPMPGTVRQVPVSAGDAFDAHVPLVIMESMKMELTLSAPHAGRVREVCCHPGQLVELGAVLVRFEDSSTGAGDEHDVA